MPKRATRPPSLPTPSAEAIARSIAEIYRGPSWHGPSVRSALRGVDAAKAAWRPAPERNSIHDLMLHLTYARHRMLGRLEAVRGGRASRFPRPMRLSWFPRGPDRLDEATWREDLRFLDEYQEKVLEALRDVDAATLELRRRGKAVTIGDELMGLAFHDAYHAGQIRLLALLAS